VPTNEHRVELEDMTGQRPSKDAEYDAVGAVPCRGGGMGTQDGEALDISVFCLPPPEHYPELTVVGEH